MKTFLVLLAKELRACFYSPMAYIVLAMVMLINGFSFRAAIAALEKPHQSGSIVTWTFTADWFWYSYFFIFPLVTMRLFAEERKMGTFETLFTVPVRTWQVVASKFVSSVIFYSILWVPSFLTFRIFNWMTAGAAEIPTGALLGTYILLFFMGLFNLAVGCFASSLTSNQIVAAVLSFTISLMHYLMGLFILYLGRQIPEKLVDFVYYIASIEHIRTFTAGLLDTRPLIYYSSLTLLFLALTHHVLEYRRWKA